MSLSEQLHTIAKSRINKQEEHLKLDMTANPTNKEWFQ